MALDRRAQPAWVTRLMTTSQHAPSIHYGPEQVTLRHAAVLVLLTEGPGFLVHPVLVWSEQATSSWSVNYAEVAACLEIPLCQLADRHRPIRPAGRDGHGPAEPQPGASSQARRP